jgi:hypothetical protein
MLCNFSFIYGVSRMNLDDGHNHEQQPEHSEPQSTISAGGQKDSREDSSRRLTGGQCRYIKSGGGYCQANALTGSSYCYFHSPDVAEERQEARVKGGKERSRKATVLPPDTPDMPLTTSADVTNLLAQTINKVLRGQLDPHVSNAVGFLAGHLLKAQQQEQIERRLQRVESILHHKWANPKFGLEQMSESTSFRFHKAEPGGEA